MAVQLQTDVLGKFLSQLGFSASPSLATPSWNGQTMTQVYPWGTIRQPTCEANRATAGELSVQEQDEIKLRAGAWLDKLGYASYLSPTRKAA